MGATGATGAMGATGAAGADLAIESKINCSKIVGNMGFRYYTAKFDNGMRLVLCEISDLSSSFSHTDLFAADQTGATNGQCIVTYDVDTASGGWWFFTLSPRRALYNDSTSGQNTTQVTFADGDCTN